MYISCDLENQRSHWCNYFYVAFKISVVSVVIGEHPFHIVSKFSVVSGEIPFYFVSKFRVASVVTGEIIIFM